MGLMYEVKLKKQKEDQGDVSILELSDEDEN